MTTADAPDDDEDWTDDVSDDGDDEVETDDGSDDEDWTDDQWVSWAMKKAHAPSVPVNACQTLACAYGCLGGAAWPSEEERNRMLFPVIEMLHNTRLDWKGEERRYNAIWSLAARVWVPRTIFMAVCALESQGEQYEWLMKLGADLCDQRNLSDFDFFAAIRRASSICYGMAFDDDLADANNPADASDWPDEVDKLVDIGDGAEDVEDVEEPAETISCVIRAMNAVVTDRSYNPNDICDVMGAVIHLACAVSSATFYRACPPEDASDADEKAFDVECDAEHSFVLRLCAEELNEVVINDLLLASADTASTVE